MRAVYKTIGLKIFFVSALLIAVAFSSAACRRQDADQDKKVFSLPPIPDNGNYIDYIESIKITPNTGKLSREEILKLNKALVQLLFLEYNKGNQCVRISSDCDVFTVLNNTYQNQDSWFTLQMQAKLFNAIDLASLVTYIESQLEAGHTGTEPAEHPRWSFVDFSNDHTTARTPEVEFR